MDFNFDPEEMKRQQDEAAGEKRNLAIMGGIGDALASQQSFGNVFLGRPNPQSTAVSKTAGAMADSIQDPTERQGKLYQAYKQAKEAKKLEEEDANTAQLKDMGSSATKARRMYAKKYLPPGTDVDSMSGYDIDQILSVPKMLETEAQSRVTFDNDMAKLKFSKNADMEKMREEQRIKSQDRLTEQAAKRSEGLTEGRKAVDKDFAKDYNDFTGGGEAKAKDAIAKLNSLRAEIANDKGFVQAGGGPIAGSMPDMFRTQASIARRDNIVSVANSALKATFGGQLSDGERNALAKEFYNDKLSNAENLKIIDRKIAELNHGLGVQKAKSAYFQKKGTLSGFGGTEGGDRQFAQDVVDYATKHGISNEEAQAVKDQRTSGQTAGR